MSKLVKRKDGKGGRNVVELSADILKRHKKYTHSFSAISNTDVAFYVIKMFSLISKTTYTKNVKRHCAIFVFAQITIHFLFYFFLFLNHVMFYETTKIIIIFKTHYSNQVKQLDA